jgi:hypothetical protein
MTDKQKRMLFAAEQLQEFKHAVQDLHDLRMQSAAAAEPLSELGRIYRALGSELDIVTGWLDDRIKALYSTAVESP